MAKKGNINKIKPKLDLLKKNLSQVGINDSKVYLFGSWAKGKEHEYSDIDICIVSDQFKDKNRFDDTLRIIKVARKIDENIEPILLNFKDFENKYDTLVTEVKKYGILI